MLVLLSFNDEGGTFGLRFLSLGRSGGSVDKTQIDIDDITTVKNLTRLYRCGRKYIEWDKTIELCMEIS